MSVVEHHGDWTEQERLEWIKTYQGILDAPINNWIPEYEIEYKKKCCDNCRYFDEDCCDEDVSNVYAENLIKDSDTFYCSYHKFKV